MTHTSPGGLVDRLAGYDSVVEVGVGHRIDLCADLAARGVAVTATDVVRRTVPRGVSFVRDDVTDPDLAIYAETGAIVAQRLPPELQGPTWELARQVGADLFFTTLGTDPVLVPAETVTLESGPVYVSSRR